MSWQHFSVAAGRGHVELVDVCVISSPAQKLQRHTNKVKLKRTVLISVITFFRNIVELEKESLAKPPV